MICKPYLTFVLVALSSAAVVCRAQPCPATATLTAPLANTTTVELAVSHLMAANRVQSGDVAYRAGQSVTLASGFEVKPGAVFEAAIVPCPTAPPARPDGQESVLTLGAYPNPFSTNTLIEYYLPEATVVSVSIIDTRGVILSRLVSDERQAEGSHRVTFESAALPEGVYLCLLDTPRGHRYYRIIKQK